MKCNGRGTGRFSHASFSSDHDEAFRSLSRSSSVWLIYLSTGIAFSVLKLYNEIALRVKVFAHVCWKVIESTHLTGISGGGSRLPTGLIEIDSELCKDCKLCISVCPHRLIESSDRMNVKGYYFACYIEKLMKGKRENARDAAFAPSRVPKSQLRYTVAKVLMRGNHIIAEAAVRAGCRYYFGYPITPQNEMAEYMSERLSKLEGGVFIQAESEVAAINMVIGASMTGGRAMTSSSSPGISLKQEGISFFL